MMNRPFFVSLTNIRILITAVRIVLCIPGLLMSQVPDLKQILTKTYDLTDRRDQGEIDHYLMQTTYLEMNDSGRVSKIQVVKGVFSRKMEKIENTGTVDRFLWKAVKIGEGKEKGKIRNWRVLPFTAEFEYSLCISEWTPERLPFDLAGVPPTMEGWLFVVNLMDVHTFDVLRSWDAYEHSPDRIGEYAELPAENVPVSMDFPPLFTDTYFVNGPVITFFSGLSICRDEPSALISFQAENSEVHLTVNMMDMKMPTDGISYYWGNMLISLGTGKLLQARLWERVDSLTLTPGLSAPVRGVTRREILLKRVSRQEFTDWN
jgi:hypothetical protein